MKRRITIQDLAQELQTTPSTVSRALRDHSGISDAMKKRVLDLAKLRNYKVNRMASNLRVGHSKTLGVIVPRINRDFFSNIIAGIEDIAFESKYSVMICQTHDKINKEKSYINTLISNDVAAILLSLSLETTDFEHFKEIKNLNIPLIFFDRVPTTDDNEQIVNDDKAGAFKAVSHLIEMGYKRIAHFAGPAHLKLYKDRKQGYLNALKKYKIKTDKKLIIEPALKLDEGKRAIQQLMNLANPPDALFAASDYSALGALLFLKEKGVKIPKDFGVVGFSNENFTSLISPTLTTVDQHGTQIGQLAAKSCLDIINNNNKNTKAKTIVLDPQLIIRESSLRK